MNKLNIFLDSNIFHKGTLPHRSGLFRALSMLSLKSIANIYISNVVIEELKKHYIDDILESETVVQNSIKHLYRQEYLSPMENTFMDEPSEFDAKYHFESSLRTHIRHFKIDVIRVTPKDTNKILIDSVYRTKPFINKSGAPGVMDYLIHQSYLNYVNENDLSDLVFLSNDKLLVSCFEKDGFTTFSGISEFLKSDKYITAKTEVENISIYIENHKVEIQHLQKFVSINKPEIIQVIQEKLRLNNVEVYDCYVPEIINIIQLEESELIDFQIVVHYLAEYHAPFEDPWPVHDYISLSAQCMFDGENLTDIEISTIIDLNENITFTTEETRLKVFETKRL